MCEYATDEPLVFLTKQLELERRLTAVALLERDLLLRRVDEISFDLSAIAAGPGSSPG